jgi:acyl dehydratase
MRPLSELIGQHVGYSEWVRVTQAQVNLFADATNDHQWIHTDPVRAAASRFGGAVVPGYLILSLTPSLLGQIPSLQAAGHAAGLIMSVNRGSERVRFLVPVQVDSEIRAGAVLDSVTELRGAKDLVFTVTFEVKGARVPACVAQVIVRNYERSPQPVPADRTRTGS